MDQRPLNRRLNTIPTMKFYFYRRAYGKVCREHIWFASRGRAVRYAHNSGSKLSSNPMEKNLVFMNLL